MSDNAKAPTPLKHEGTSSQVVISGAAAGLVSRFCISPLDVIKIRLQLQAQGQLLPSSNPSLHSISSPTRATTGTWSTFRTILQTEGLTAFWKGNIPAEALYLTYGASQFLGYRTASRILDTVFCTSTKDGHHVPLLPSSASSFLAGATAGTFATTVTYPLDLLRTRFAAQGQERIYASLKTSVAEIARHEGVFKGFYRGLDAAIVQIVPYMGLFFAFYETAKGAVNETPEAMKGAGEKGGMLPLQAFGSGDAVAGVVASVLAKTAVFPLDTVRKRLQVQGPTRNRYAHRGIPRYDAGVLGTLRTIAVTEGLRGLYRGLTVGLLKAAPASAITMWTYERVLGLLQRAGQT